MGCRERKREKNGRGLGKKIRRKLLRNERIGREEEKFVAEVFQEGRGVKIRRKWREE